MEERSQARDFLNKSVAFGIGVAALTGEKLKELVDQAVAKGEMSKDEAKTVMDDITAKADEEKRSVRNWINEQVNKGLREVGAADAGRVSQLEGRLSALERRIERLEAGSPKAASGACEETPTVNAE